MNLLDLCDLKKEVKCGYCITEDMKMLRNIQLNMLQKLLEVCQKYNIHVYASGGTLLGAEKDRCS